MQINKGIDLQESEQDNKLSSQVEDEAREYFKDISLPNRSKNEERWIGPPNSVPVIYTIRIVEIIIVDNGSKEF